MKTQSAFTLIELLVVVAIIAVLLAMVMPAVPRPGGRPYATACMNNHKQLALGWIMYAQDNEDQLMPSADFVGASRMSWSADNSNIDTAPLFTNAMGTYVKTVSVYKCPGDKYQSGLNPGPRVRSVSINAALGGPGPDVRGTTGGTNRVYYAQATAGPGVGRGATNMSELIHPGPANVFVTLDEHPDSIDDGIFMFDPGKDAGSQGWRDLPGSTHNGAGSFSFADGHSEVHKWLNRLKVPTAYPVTMKSSPQPWRSVAGTSDDYQWMQERMPYL